MMSSGIRDETVKVRFRNLFAALLLLLPAAGTAAEITGKTVVVADGLSTAPETQSARILAETLGKIFSCEIKVVEKKAYNGTGPAIILAPAPMDREEWCIESLSPDVARITGTPPRGVFYGVVEFLEIFGSCRYFDVDALDIPQKSAITVPHGKKFRRKPFFSSRCNSGGFWAHPGMALRRVWNKQNTGYSFWGDDRIDAEEGKTLFQYREPRSIGPSCHTFYFWSRNFPREKKEYFSFTPGGRHERAVSGAGPGQICLSHPEVRKLIKKNVLAEIAKSNKNADGKGIPRSFLLDLSHNDNGSFCVCAGCRALLAKYGKLSGVMLDFVNDIASVAPEITFQTFAYTFTEEPPRNIKPAPNVMIRIALLGHELMNGPCDTMRPFGASTNARTRYLYESWRKLTGNLSVWLYQRRFNRLFAVPAANFWYMGENFRYLRLLGVKRINIESEFGDLRDMPFPNSFYALHIYLSEKLMDDPDQDDKALIDEFMDRYYGPAGPEMKKFSAYLKRRTEEEKRPLGAVPEHDLVYLDYEFLTTINSLIGAAMKKTAGNRELQRRIELEYIPLDFAVLNMWDRIPGLEKGLKMDRNAVFARLEKALETAYEKYYVPEKYKPEKLRNARRFVRLHLDELRNPIPVPAELAGREVRQFAAGNMPNIGGEGGEDPEALRGKAQYLGPVHPKNPGFNAQLHAKPMEMGIYDYGRKGHAVRKIFSASEIHQDGKYHLYYIGRSVMPPPEGKPRLYGHWTWAFNASPAVHSTYCAQDDKALYDFFASLKFKGPAYVKESKEPNGVWLDRIIFARVSPETAHEFAGKEVFVFSSREFRPSAGRMKLSPDFQAPSVQVFKLPLRDGKVEFSFYSYKEKRHLWRRRIGPEAAQKKGYRWYFVNRTAIPPAGEKTEFAVHADWYVMPTPVFEKMRRESSENPQWDIYARLKFEGDFVFLDSIAFARVKP